MRHYTPRMTSQSRKPYPICIKESASTPHAPVARDIMRHARARTTDLLTSTPAIIIFEGTCTYHYASLCRGTIDIGQLPISGLMTIYCRRQIESLSIPTRISEDIGTTLPADPQVGDVAVARLAGNAWLCLQSRIASRAVADEVASLPRQLLALVPMQYGPLVGPVRNHVLQDPVASRIRSISTRTAHLAATPPAKTIRVRVASSE